MRSVFYSDEEIRAAYKRGAPALRDYAAGCRHSRPAPMLSSLSVAEGAQLDLIEDVLREFRATPITFPWPYLEIYHGSPITLLAANRVFGADPDASLCLLSDEYEQWHRDIFRGPDGWFGSCWVTVFDHVPEALSEEIAGLAPPEGSEFWVQTKARRGRANHELLQWNGVGATIMGVISQAMTEEGFIDNFDLWLHR